MEQLKPMCTISNRLCAVLEKCRSLIEEEKTDSNIFITAVSFSLHVILCSTIVLVLPKRATEAPESSPSALLWQISIIILCFTQNGCRILIMAVKHRFCEPVIERPGKIYHEPSPFIYHNYETQKWRNSIAQHCFLLYRKNLPYGWAVNCISPCAYTGAKHISASPSHAYLRSPTSRLQHPVPEA